MLPRQDHYKFFGSRLVIATYSYLSCVHAILKYIIYMMQIYYCWVSAGSLLHHSTFCPSSPYLLFLIHPQSPNLFTSNSPSPHLCFLLFISTFSFPFSIFSTFLFQFLFPYTKFPLPYHPLPSVISPLFSQPSSL